MIFNRNKITADAKLTAAIEAVVNPQLFALRKEISQYAYKEDLAQSNNQTHVEFARLKNELDILRKHIVISQSDIFNRIVALETAAITPAPKPVAKKPRRKVGRGGKK